MPFRCPQCAQPGALEILQSIQLSPDSRSDEILLQVIACRGCGFQGLVVYEESRRGALDSESWEHTGYRVSAAEMASTVKAIQSCPEPHNPSCTCSAHQELGRQDGVGRWKGIRGLDEAGPFRMEVSG